MQDKSQAIGEFLEWLNSTKSFVIAQYDEYHTYGCCRRHEELVPCGLTTEKLLAEFFEINLDRLEAEKEEMLEVQRRLNAHVDAD